MHVQVVHGGNQETVTEVNELRVGFSVAMRGSVGSECGQIR